MVYGALSNSPAAVTKVVENVFNFDKTWTANWDVSDECIMAHTLLVDTKRGESFREAVIQHIDNLSRKRNGAQTIDQFINTFNEYQHAKGYRLHNICDMVKYVTITKDISAARMIAAVFLSTQNITALEWITMIEEARRKTMETINDVRYDDDAWAKQYASIMCTGLGKPNAAEPISETSLLDIIQTFRSWDCESETPQCPRPNFRALHFLVMMQPYFINDHYINDDNRVLYKKSTDFRGRVMLTDEVKTINNEYNTYKDMMKQRFKQTRDLSDKERQYNALNYMVQIPGFANDIRNADSTIKMIEDRCSDLRMEAGTLTNELKTAYNEDWTKEIGTQKSLADVWQSLISKPTMPNLATTSVPEERWRSVDASAARWLMDLGWDEVGAWEVVDAVNAVTGESFAAKNPDSDTIKVKEWQEEMKKKNYTIITSKAASGFKNVNVQKIDGNITGRWLLKVENDGVTKRGKSGHYESKLMAIKDAAEIRHRNSQTSTPSANPSANSQTSNPSTNQSSRRFAVDVDTGEELSSNHNGCDDGLGGGNSGDSGENGDGGNGDSGENGGGGNGGSMENGGDDEIPNADEQMEYMNQFPKLKEVLGNEIPAPSWENAKAKKKTHPITNRCYWSTKTKRYVFAQFTTRFNENVEDKRYVCTNCGSRNVNSTIFDCARSTRCRDNECNKCKPNSATASPITTMSTYSDTTPDDASAAEPAAADAIVATAEPAAAAAIVATAVAATDAIVATAVAAADALDVAESAANATPAESESTALAVTNATPATAIAEPAAADDTITAHFDNIDARTLPELQKCIENFETIIKDGERELVIKDNELQQCENALQKCKAQKTELNQAQVECIRLHDYACKKLEEANRKRKADKHERKVKQARLVYEAALKNLSDLEAQNAEW